jgi:DNA-binding transcriptional MocR family regulator
LLNHPQLADRVIYIRSFSKAIAPDLRVAVGVAQPRLVNLLTEAKSFTDGWSSRLSQRALAHLLTDPDLDPALDASRRVYDHRREVAKDILAEHLARLGGSVRGEDGLSLWVQLCPGMDAGNVIERAGGQGVLVTPGEPFFIRPGRNDVLRMSISNVDEAGAIAAAGRLASVLQDTSAVPATTIPI